MQRDDPHGITRILGEIREGDMGAAERLFVVVYQELRQLARIRMSSEQSGQTLQPTALVNEAYLRLFGSAEDPSFDNRAHFFGAAGEAMRRILIERARSRSAQKRGGEQRRVDLDSHMAVDEPTAPELLALDQALDRLEERDEEMARVVKLRYFAGMTVPETATALGLSERSVNRAWTAARAWLHRELERP